MVALQSALLFLLTAILVVSPWLIRNYLWTNNPFYPMFDGFFNPTKATEVVNDEHINSLKGAFATRKVLYGESFLNILILPIRIFFQGMDDSPQYFDGRLNPFLLLLAPFAFFKSKTIPYSNCLELNTLFFFSVLYILFAFNISVLRIRYLAPIVPALVILSVYGLANISIFTQRKVSFNLFSKVLVSITVYLMMYLNISYIAVFIHQTKSYRIFEWTHNQSRIYHEISARISCNPICQREPFR